MGTTLRAAGAAVVLPVLLFLSGCATEADSAQRFSRDWGTWKTKQEGTPAKVTADLREVVRDPKRWGEFWAGEAPPVDFTKEMVLVATVKLVEHPKDIPRIWRLKKEEDKEPVAYVRVRQVGGEFKNEFAGSAAYHFAVVPRSEEVIHWKDIRVVYTGDGDVDGFEVVKNYDD